jgi:hypothetical protein
MPMGGVYLFGKNEKKQYIYQGGSPILVDADDFAFKISTLP